MLKSIFGRKEEEEKVKKALRKVTTRDAAET